MGDRLEAQAPRGTDVAVLGATGFTGQRVLEYLVNWQHAGSMFASTAEGTLLSRSVRCNGRHDCFRSIAAAGRDERKLLRILREIDAEEKVKVVVVDVSKSDQVLQLAKDTRLLLNCVGPYRYTGEGIVSACVQAGTDYMDVSGEPEFMEAVEYKYREQARASGCFIASGVGFDSVPADLGTIFVQNKLSDLGTPATVESFLTLHTTAKQFRANYATWESLVEGMGSIDQLQKLRREARKSRKSLPPPKTVGPKLSSPAGASYDQRVKAYVIPFPGADASVVRRTQKVIASLNGDAVQYAASFAVQSIFSLVLLFIFAAIVKILSAYSYGRWLLLRFPRVFSYGTFQKQGPSQHHLDSTSFAMQFIGKAYSRASDSASQLPDKEVRMRLVGPDPGYVATPIFMVQAALTFLEERESIVQSLGNGGVFTPGALLGQSSYTSRLQKAGISFREE